VTSPSCRGHYVVQPNSKPDIVGRSSYRCPYCLKAILYLRRMWTIYVNVQRGAVTGHSPDHVSQQRQIWPIDYSGDSQTTCFDFQRSHVAPQPGHSKIMTTQAFNLQCVLYDSPQGAFGIPMWILERFPTLACVFLWPFEKRLLQRNHSRVVARRGDTMRQRTSKGRRASISPTAYPASTPRPPSAACSRSSSFGRLA
jgi:hypothetical protein